VILRTWAPVACARLSAVVLAVTVVAIGAVTPGYRPWADTVSRLGSPGQPHAWAARAAFVLYGLLVLAGASAACGSHRLVRLYGVAAIVAGVAPKDPPGSHHTLLSAIHVDATMLGGVAILIAMLAVGCDGRSSSTCRRGSLAAAGITSVRDGVPAVLGLRGLRPGRTGVAGGAGAVGRTVRVRRSPVEEQWHATRFGHRRPLVGEDRRSRCTQIGYSKTQDKRLSIQAGDA
jgi:hypothetical protein